LAENAPTVFYVHVESFLKKILSVTKDNNILIREAAVDALRVVLELIATRESSHRMNWYYNIYDDVHKVFSLSLSNY